MRKLRVLVATLGVSLPAVVLVAQRPALPLLPAEDRTPAAACGTTRDDSTNGRLRPLALPSGLPDGEPFSFDQDPPLLYPDDTGTLALHNFSVVGDFATVQFVRSTRDAAGVTETWTRTTTRSVSGQLVSVFDPAWGSAEIDNAFSLRRVGYDRPFLYWGAFVIPGSSVQRLVYVRTGFHGIPASTVVRINDQVQYASDVVNIVVPTFDDARVSLGANGFDVASAARLFYRYFADTYDVVAFQPRSTAVGDFSAFHRNVRNGVSGLNIVTFDDSRTYGSNGVLQGVEVYAGGYGALYDVTDHEMAHQWLSNFDWSRIAQIARGGHQPTAHSPLWTGGETLIGAVLFGNRRVASSGDRYTIEQTPAPAHFHPLEMYAMGLTPASGVPDFSVFADQTQFDANNSVSPDLGTAVTGDTKAVTIDDVIRATGVRSGPAITSSWRRATVLVSNDRLASQQEMDYWNFFAQRLGDRNHASRPAFDNYVSFRVATGGAVDLRTAAAPAGAASLPQTLDIDTPTFSGNDWRGVSFDSPVPSRFVVGQPVTLAGHVTAADHDFTSITVGFWALNSSTPINFSATMNRSHDFSVTIRFTDAQRGRYYLANYLFWANSGSQFPRSSASTVVVE